MCNTICLWLFMNRIGLETSQRSIRWEEKGERTMDEFCFLIYLHSFFCVMILKTKIIEDITCARYCFKCFTNIDSVS